MNLQVRTRNQCTYASASFNSGSNVSFWSQLCLYTCFILQRSGYDVFNSLVDQFSTLRKGHSLTREDSILFFKDCFAYLIDALANSSSKPIAITIIVRMIGLLNIHKTNFEPTDHITIEFTKVIFHYISEHSVGLLDSETVE